MEKKSHYKHLLGCHASTYHIYADRMDVIVEETFAEETHKFLRQIILIQIWK